VNSIVSFLFKLVQSLLTKIEELESIIESLSPAKPDFDIRSPKYKCMTVDKPPVVRTFEKQDHQELLRRHEHLYGKPLRTV
jgi:hypothetical protein